MKKRNTKQKQIILDTLRNDRTHPTMAEIYEKVSKQYPTIGQATIYRNVNSLSQANLIEKIADSNGIFHYDGNPKKHIHLICKNCGRIIDIFQANESEFISQVAASNSIVVESANITLEGLCRECNKLLSIKEK